MKSLFFLIVLFVFVFGCTNTLTPTDFAKTDPQIKEFLEENPDAIVRQKFLNLETVTSYFSKLKADCGIEMVLQPYWEVTIVSEGKEILFYADEELTTVYCKVLPEDIVVEKANCQKQSDCIDGDPLTKDLCTGTPKKCVNQRVLCEEARGIVCEEHQRCTIEENEARDAACCLGKCVLRESCVGIKCEQGTVCQNGICIDPDKDVCDDVNCTVDKKCLDGVCVLKECKERGGFLCAGIWICKGQNLTSIEVDVCCDRECVKSTCTEQRGSVCVAGETCTGEIGEAVDSPVCCLENPLKCSTLCLEGR